jgi:hypothetical protein
MLRRFYHSQFFAKLFYELLPATIASAIGAYFINSYIRPSVAPPSGDATPASAELVQLMRDQQTLLSDYLKKSAEARQRADDARQRADLAMAQEADRLKAAEREAVQALREAKAAEMRALAAAVRAAETPERRLAAKPPAVTPAPQTDKTQMDKVPVGEPMQLHQAASATPQPQTQSSSQQPAPATAAGAPSQDNGAIATVRNAVSGIVHFPARVSDWLTDAAPPPRPPTDLPQRQFMKALMP